MAPSVETTIVEAPEEWIEAAAGRILASARAAIEARGVFRVALAGGSTPRAVYQRLARARPDLGRWHFFFGDERCVPPEDPSSNYGMARDAWLGAAKIPAAQVHRMRGEDDPAIAAEAYERTLRREIPAEPGSGPRLDLVLLGLGTDGHTASLFPGTGALTEAHRLCCPVEVPLLGMRLTLTFPMLEAAREVLFLVRGSDKAEAVRAVLRPEEGAGRPPAWRVRPRAGRVTWLLDGAAAAGIRSPSQG